MPDVCPFRSTFLHSSPLLVTFWMLLQAIQLSQEVKRFEMILRLRQDGTIPSDSHIERDSSSVDESGAENSSPRGNSRAIGEQKLTSSSSSSSSFARRPTICTSTAAPRHLPGCWSPPPRRRGCSVPADGPDPRCARKCLEPCERGRRWCERMFVCARPLTSCAGESGGGSKVASRTPLKTIGGADKTSDQRQKKVRVDVVQSCISFSSVPGFSLVPQHHVIASSVVCMRPNFLTLFFPCLCLFLLLLLSLSLGPSTSSGGGGAAALHLEKCPAAGQAGQGSCGNPCIGGRALGRSEGRGDKYNL